MKRLTYEEYVEAGEDKGLIFIGQEVPNNVVTPTDWRCKLTGVEMRKSYSAVKNYPYGSRYQRNFDENYQRYLDLAAELGIEFLYEAHREYFPATTKDIARWRGPSGTVVEASFHQLGYGRISRELCEELGIPYVEKD
jgi:hypothetical protein